MKGQTKPAKGWSIKQDGRWFKVYDKDSKFRQKFPERSQADAYIEAHTMRQHHAPENA